MFDPINRLDELWMAADRAMYMAKRSGGDAVGTAAELFAENSDEVTPEPVRT
ncbi:MAG TPA: hypothetical protein VD765_06105 [Solirubrobacterales bacterium]|nr:hypothetical protein [Solirubrobacterales bacterium]